MIHFSRFYLPSMIADTLTSDEPSALVPSEMQEKVGKLKKKVESEVKKIPVFLSEQKISYEDLINIIDRANTDPVADWPVTPRMC